eukprot:CAMPEP_0185273780 /NCGR_PEP_ID=MMETSP1359-20130426/50353_1 /TAXON_ID=552665 /ORGANISM="Bigelowiella longifila, Strain CCMP242" /LENGTH=242 /DNA_ID=CAMNT_0027866539 /DNA_START=39 /DNA_END=767 /DNA_ORIENTATION=+
MEQEGQSQQPEQQKLLHLLKKIEASSSCPSPYASSSSSSSNSSGDTGHGGISTALKKAAKQGCSWEDSTSFHDTRLEDNNEEDDDDDDGVDTGDNDTEKEKLRRQKDFRWITIRSDLISRDTEPQFTTREIKKRGYTSESGSLEENHVDPKHSSGRDNEDTRGRRQERGGRPMAGTIQAHAIHSSASSSKSLLDMKLDLIPGAGKLDIIPGKSAMIDFHQQRWRQQHITNRGKSNSRKVFRK